MERIEIHEAGLLLRPWRAQDADAVHRACQDPEIQRWTSVPRPYRPEHAEGFVTKHTEQAWASGTGAPFGVFDAATGELLGSNGLIWLDDGAGEVGFWVAPWARRRGVATDSTRALARWCLGPLGLQRLAWRAKVGNHASRLVAERVGFRLEGVLRDGGRWWDGRRVDCWLGGMVAGQLREADAPADPVVALRGATFSAPQPRLSALTPGGEKVTLRAPEPRDLDAIVAACRDAESLRWTTVPEPYGPADARFFVNQHAPGRWARGEGGVFAIVDAADAYAGSMELRITAPDTGEVGFLVAPGARGRGYGSTALRAVCAWGFTALGLDRIEWRAYLGNDASRRVAEKAGFTIEGVARAGCVQRGEHRDAWVGAILATDPHP